MIVRSERKNEIETRLSHIQVAQFYWDMMQKIYDHRIELTFFSLFFSLSEQALLKCTAEKKHTKDKFVERSTYVET